MLVRKILRPCIALRNTVALTQRTSAYHITHVKKVKDDVQTARGQYTSDILLEELDSNIPSKILLCLENNKGIVKGCHIIMALTRFMKLYLNQKYIGNVGKVKDEEFFSQLCSILKLNIHKLNGSEIVQILEIFEKMNVPKNLPIVQLLFQYVKNHSNDLSLIEIDTLASQMRKSSKINKTFDALEHSFIIKMSMEFDENNVSHLAHALSFLTYSMKDDNLKYIVINKLKNLKSQIPLKYAINILQSLCEFLSVPQNNMEEWITVYNKVLNVISEDSEFLNPDQTSYVSFIVSENINNRKAFMKDQLYNEVFFNNIVKKAVGDDIGFEKALSILKNLNTIRHESQELLNYCSASYFEKIVMTEEQIEDEAGKLLVLIHGMALTLHKTVFWDQIENYINNNEKTLLNYDYKTTCILSMNLALLDCYPNFLMKKVFDGKYDYSANSFMHWTFCKLYQKIKFDPTYSGPMPTESQIKSLEILQRTTWSRSSSYSFLFVDILKEWLGDNKYFKINLLSKSFHVIDYFLVFDENKKPVPINTSGESSTEPEYIEDYNFPSNYKKICVIHMPHFWYWRNVNKLLGLYTMLIDTLEKTGCTVVHINKADWDALPTNQRKDFIINQIKLKLDDS